MMMRATSMWSDIASKKNEDGTTSIVTVSPGAKGFSLLLGTRDNKTILTLNDGQHEYVWVKN